MARGLAGLLGGRPGARAANATGGAAAAAGAGAVGGRPGGLAGGAAAAVAYAGLMSRPRLLVCGPPGSGQLQVRACVRACARVLHLRTPSLSTRGAGEERGVRVHDVAGVHGGAPRP